MLLIIMSSMLVVYLALRGSLPQLDGSISLTGLRAPVSVERDALGIATIRAQNRQDLAYVTGFVHGQERFFQMDLLRRAAAGELAELFGEAALAADMRTRVHRFRSRAQQLVAQLPESHLALLRIYTAGVNAAIDTLAARPFEYFLLGVKPLPWRAEDTLLVIYAMYLDLQDETARLDHLYGLMHDVLPGALYRFLTPAGTQWDAPLQGDAVTQPPIPGPEVFDLRQHTPSALHDQLPFDQAALGSNNWAVSGRLTHHGGAILANDMHLRLRVPNTWYRAALIYPDESGAERRIEGVTLPGTPVVVAGSNGHIAWGFTNAYGDWFDLVIVQSAAEGRYLTPEGPKSFQYYEEQIRIKDGTDVVLPIVETLWGPVIDRDHRGRQRALRWTAHESAAINFALLDLEVATRVSERISHRPAGRIAGAEFCRCGCGW